MSHPFPGPNADDASEDADLPWAAPRPWQPGPTTWRQPATVGFDAPHTITTDVAHHQAAWHDALGTPIRPEWITPLGGPSVTVLADAIHAATRRLTLWHRAGPPAAAAAQALLTRWPEAVPGWLECSDMERPLVALLHRLRTTYAAHQLHVRVPTIGGRTGTRALMDLVRECCNPQGAPTSLVDCEGRPIRHGDVLMEDADSRGVFVRGQHAPYLAVVAEDAADGEWMTPTAVRTMTLGWTRTPPTTTRPLRHSVAVHHPAVPYALIVCAGVPGTLGLIPDGEDDA